MRADRRGLHRLRQWLRLYAAQQLVCAPGCNTLETLEAKMNQRLSQISADAGKAYISQLFYHTAPLIMAECSSKGFNISQKGRTRCGRASGHEQ